MIISLVLQGSGSGSMFVQSLRGDPFRVSSAFTIGLLLPTSS